MENFRRFAKSRLGQFSMLLVLAPMAFLGMSASNSGSHAPDEVVQAGDTSIGLRELQAAITDQKSFLIQNGVDASLIKEDALQEQVLQGLINRALLEQQAQKLGYTVSDSYISQQLQQAPNFKDADGNFSNELFANLLQSNGLTKDQLFAQRRKALAVDQLSNGILTTAIYPSKVIESLMDVQLQTKELWLHRIAWQDYQDKISITDADIEAYYNQNKEKLYSIPMVDLSYIRLTADMMTVDEITDEELNQQYELYKEQKNLTDLRQVSQILLTGDDAESKAKSIKAELDDGADFSKLAKEKSDDLSAEDGGAIGTFNSAVFADNAKIVEDAMNGLSVGDISQPVKTSFGYHIFKVTSDEGDSVPTLESLKDELTKIATDYKKQAKFNEKIAEINVLSVDNYSLQDIAAQESLNIEVIKDYQKEENLSDLSQPVVISKAFDEFIINDESVSDAIEVDKSMVWIQPANFRPRDLMSLETATPTIKTRLKQQKAIDMALKDAEKLAKTVTDKESLKQEGTKFIPLGEVNRQNPLLDSSEGRAAFSNNESDGSDTLLATAITTDNGASVVVAGKLKSADKSQMSDAEKQQVGKTLSTALGNSHLEDYLDYLNNITKIERNEKKLNEAEGL